MAWVAERRRSRFRIGANPAFSRLVCSLRAASISLRFAAVMIHAAGILRNPFRRPGSERRGKRLLHRFFGAIERPGNSNQCGDNPARFLPENRIDRRTGGHPFRFRQAGQRPDFDASFPAPAPGRNPHCPFDRFVQVFAFENVIAGQVFFGFRERSVGHQRLALRHPHRSRGGDRRQRFRALQHALPPGFVHHDVMTRANLLGFLGRQPTRRFGRIDQHHVTHRISSPGSSVSAFTSRICLVCRSQCAAAARIH